MPTMPVVTLPLSKQITLSSRATAKAAIDDLFQQFSGLQGIAGVFAFHECEGFVEEGRIAIKGGVGLQLLETVQGFVVLCKAKVNNTCIHSCG